MSRKRIYEIIEKSGGKDKWSTFYDVFMIIIWLQRLEGGWQSRKPGIYGVLHLDNPVFVVDNNE